MMFEFYTDLDKLIAEFPRFIRDRANFKSS